VALGGDGFMLGTLHATQALDVAGLRDEPWHRRVSHERLFARQPARALAVAEEAILNPLSCARPPQRAGPCTRRWRSTRCRCCGRGRRRRGCASASTARAAGGAGLRRRAAVTPAGSTAYNYSAHGPILPIGAEVLALTAMAAFRPRRWRGALLPKTARVRFEVSIPPSARSWRMPTRSRCAMSRTVDIRSEPEINHRLLFDPGHGLEERLIREQFAGADGAGGLGIDVGEGLDVALGVAGGNARDSRAAAGPASAARVRSRFGSPSGAYQSRFGSSWSHSSPPSAPKTRSRRPFSWPGATWLAQSRPRAPPASRSRTWALSSTRRPGHEARQLGRQRLDPQAGDELDEVEGMRADVADGRRRPRARDRCASRPACCRPPRSASPARIRPAPPAAAERARRDHLARLRAPSDSRCSCA
jgi:NAD+ kinase